MRILSQFKSLRCYDVLLCFLRPFGRSVRSPTLEGPKTLVAAISRLPDVARKARQGKAATAFCFY